MTPDAPPHPVRTVIVTYLRPDELTTTLARLADQTLRAERTVVVDNDPAGSAEAVAPAHAPDTTYVGAGDNLGPAGGLRVGIDRCLEDGFEGWILCVDDDNHPPNDRTVEQLVGLAEGAREADPFVGGVGLSGAIFDRTRSRIDRLADDALGGIHDVDHLPGNQFPLYWSGALRSVGGHDPTFFFGFEELDLGLRLRDAGWRLLVDGDRLLELRKHFGTTGKDRNRGGAPRPEVPWRRYYSARNLVRISRTYGSWRGTTRATVGPIGRSAVDVLRRRPGAPALLTAAGRGVLDAWRGRVGRIVEPDVLPPERTAEPSP